MTTNKIKCFHEFREGKTLKSPFAAVVAMSQKQKPSIEKGFLKELENTNQASVGFPSHLK